MMKMIKNKVECWLKSILHRAAYLFCNCLMLIVLTSGMHIATADMYPVLSHTLLNIEVANTGYTRFSINGEKINDAFIYPEHLAETIIHKSGFILVLPDSSVKSLGNRAVVYLTLIGENGTVQDMRLKFNNDSPKPVELGVFNLEKEVNQTTLNSTARKHNNEQQ